MGYLAILASETWRCFFSYGRKRLEGVKVPTWQLAEELRDWLAEHQPPRAGLPGPLRSVRCHDSQVQGHSLRQDLTAGHLASVSFRAQQRGIRRLTMFTLEIWAYQPTAQVCQAVGAHSQENPRAVPPPQYFPLLHHLGCLLEAESGQEIPGAIM